MLIKDYMKNLCMRKISYNPLFYFFSNTQPAHTSDAVIHNNPSILHLLPQKPYLITKNLNLIPIIYNNTITSKSFISLS